VILSHYECTEWELYMALLCAVKLAGRTKEELEYVCLHGHIPGERRGKKLHSVWEVEARADETIRRRGLRMVEDVSPAIDPAALDGWLLTVRKFRGKSADELRFIALHGRDPESVAELASFVAGPRYSRPADCAYCCLQ
jgi:hypothetical protein